MSEVSTSASPRCVKVGSSTLQAGSGLELQYLQDSSQLVDDAEALRKELKERGYIYLRGLHDRGVVLKARHRVLQYLHEEDPSLFVQGRWSEGVLPEETADKNFPFMEGQNSITHSEDVLGVIQGQRIKRVCELIFGESSKTFDFKWLRAVPHGCFTGAHVDRVYMSRGTDSLLTCWTPLDDVPMEMGTLAICEGSHKMRGFEHFHQTYGALDMARDNVQGTGWFTNDPREITERFGGVWKTADFKAGDVLIFTMRTVHMSTVNTTYLARISCDTRWLPESHAADERFMAPIKDVAPEYGIYAKDTGKRTMEDMKALWGFA